VKVGEMVTALVAGVTGFSVVMSFVEKAMKAGGPLSVCATLDGARNRPQIPVRFNVPVAIGVLMMLCGVVLAPWGLALLVPAGLTTIALDSAVKERAAAKSRRRKERQMFGMVVILYSCFRAGGSLVEGLRSCLSLPDGPVRSEVQRVLAGINAGKNPPEALWEAFERTGAHLWRYVALVNEVHSRTGGNLSSMLTRVMRSLDEERLLRMELEAKMTDARLTVWALTLAPLCLSIFLQVTQVEVMRQFYSTLIGRGILAYAGLSWFVGFHLMKRMATVRGLR